MVGGKRQLIRRSAISDIGRHAIMDIPENKEIYDEQIKNVSPNFDLSELLGELLSEFLVTPKKNLLNIDQYGLNFIMAQKGLSLNMVSFITQDVNPSDITDLIKSIDQYHTSLSKLKSFSSKYNLNKSIHNPDRLEELITRHELNDENNEDLRNMIFSFYENHIKLPLDLQPIPSNPLQNIGSLVELLHNISSDNDIFSYAIKRVQEEFYETGIEYGIDVKDEEVVKSDLPDFYVVSYFLKIADKAKEILDNFQIMYNRMAELGLFPNFEILLESQNEIEVLKLFAQKYEQFTGNDSDFKELKNLISGEDVLHNLDYLTENPTYFSFAKTAKKLGVSSQTYKNFIFNNADRNLNLGERQITAIQYLEELSSHNQKKSMVKILLDSDSNWYDKGMDIDKLIQSSYPEIYVKNYLDFLEEGQYNKIETLLKLTDHSLEINKIKDLISIIRSLEDIVIDDPIQLLNTPDQINSSKSAVVKIYGMDDIYNVPGLLKDDLDLAELWLEEHGLDNSLFIDVCTLNQSNVTRFVRSVNTIFDSGNVKYIRHFKILLQNEDVRTEFYNWLQSKPYKTFFEVVDGLDNGLTIGSPKYNVDILDAFIGSMGKQKA